MVEVVTSLAQFGAVGVFAASMFLLHVWSLRACRDELRLEREGFAARTSDIVGALREQTAILATKFDQLSAQIHRIEVERARERNRS